jgi:hypothetical protein
MYSHCELQACKRSCSWLALQLLRKMGFSTLKAHAMFRPSDMKISKVRLGQACAMLVAGCRRWDM